MVQCADVIGRKSEVAKMELLVEDEDDCFEAIGKLIAQGINAGDIKKLQDAGIYTCHGLMMPTKKSITGIKRLSEAVDKICEAAGKIIRRSVVKITTGSQVIDELLGGENSVARSGKTQLAHTLCVSTQLPLSMRGGNGKLAVVTEGTFRPDRIVPIAEQCGLDSGAVLDNYNNEKIIFARAYTYEHQYDLLGLAAKLSEEPFGLLIIDLIIAMFRVDFSGRDELAEDQQRLVQMLPRIIKIVEKFNVVVYMTNQGGRLFISDSKKPAGGYVLTRAATVRLLFKKVKGEQRVCKVFDPPNLPESEASGSYGEGFGFDYGAVCDNIIDSASFRNDFSERGELAERQQGDDCFENYMQLMEHVEDEDNCFEAIVQWSGVSILDSKNPARDSALYQEVTRRLTFMGKGEQTPGCNYGPQTFHTKAVMHANHARHGVRTQHGLTGNKGVRKSSYSRNRKRLKRYKTPRKNLPQTKERKKNAVEYSLTPFFLEYRPLSRSCDVYDLAHDMWDTHALPADAMTDNLYSYQPGVMIAVNNAHPDTPMTRRVMLSMSCFLNSWTSLGDLDEIECPYLISRTNRWTTVIGAGMDSRVYDSIHSEPRISANLPLTLAEAQHAHCLQVGPNLFVLSLLHNRFCALKLGAPSNWIQTRTLLPGEDLVMCGYHNEFLILVKWTAQSIQIHRMGLNRNGLPVPGVQFSVANAPPNVVQNIHLERHNHPERKIRMTGDVVFLYERPHLHHFTIGSGAWGHAINEQLPNFWSPNEIPLTIAGYFLPDPAE